MEKEGLELSAAALEALPLAVLLVDVRGAILGRNRAAGELLPPGETLEGVLRGPPGSEAAIDWPAELAAVRAAGRPVRHANLRLQADGRATRLVEVQLAPLPEAPEAMLVVVEDVTPRASMERRLATSERLAAVGKLAAQVAHELNTPLDGIGRYLGLAERAGQNGQAGKSAEYLARIREGLDRMARVIRELLDFSRSSMRGAESGTVSELVSQALEAMSPTLEGSGVTVVCDLGSEQGCLAPVNLFQVFCNLMKNAADAMPSGGLLLIAVRRPPKPGLDGPAEGTHAGGWVVITFADTGGGIPPDLLEQIFEPFFSTRTGRGGTGLGLTICRDIVERCGGTLSAGNRPEGGAVFTISIPCPSTGPSRRPGPGRPDGPGGAT